MFGLFSANVARRAAILLLTASALSACDPSGITLPSSGSGDGPRVNPRGTLNIAILVPSGSGDANQERLADDLVRAAEMALKNYPETKIALRVYPTAGNATTASAAAQKALNDGAKVIIGPLFAEAANAAGQVAAAKGVNVLSFSNNTDVAGGNVFVMGNTFQNTADRIVGYAASKGFRSVAVVAPQNSSGELAAAAVRGAAAKSGARVTGTFSYPFSPEGISSNIPGIVNRLQSSGTSAVVVTADSASGLPIIGSMMPVGSEEVPSNIKVLGLARWDIPVSTLSSAGLSGGWFAIPDRSAITKFNSVFRSTYGDTPHPLSGIAFDGVTAVAELFSQGNAGAVQRSQLTRASGFAGAQGAFRLKTNGSTQRALSVAEVSSGAFRVISSAPKSFGDSGS